MQEICVKSVAINMGKAKRLLIIHQNTLALEFRKIFLATVG